MLNEGIVLTSHAAFPRDFVKGVADALGVVPYLLDESTPGKLLRNTHLHSCFGVMQQLGFGGEYKLRTLDSRFATLALNVENVDMILVAMDSISSDSIFLGSPNVADKLTNYIKWAIKVLSRLSTDLSDLIRDQDLRNSLHANDYHGCMKFMRDKSFPALRLVFCSSTRRALISLCYRIERIENSSRLNAGNNVPLYNMEEYQKFLDIIRTIPVDISQINQLLQRVDWHIQQSFNQIHSYASISEERLSRRSAELDLLFRSGVDRVFFTAFNQFVTSGFPSRAGYGYPYQRYPSLWKLSQDPQPEELQVLETIDIAASLSAREQQHLHVNVVGFIDTILPNSSGRWNRCVRCTSIMGNMRYELNHYLLFIATNLKKCPCGGSWELLLEG